MVDMAMEGKILAKFEFPVERGKIKEFALATGNPHPLYLDRKHAQDEGFPDVIMPVTFPVTFPFHSGMSDTVMDMMKMLGMNPRTSVHGEVELTHHRIIHAGETLNCEIKVEKIYSKEGKTGGKMTFVEIVLNLYDAENSLACVLSNLFIEKS